MGVMHRITAAIESFKGLEKRRSDLIDKPGHFNELTNAAVRSSGALNKRKGFHTISSNIPAAGANITNNELGIASYSPADELLVMNKNLKKVVEEKVTFNNTSSTTDVIASFMPNQDNTLEYRFKARSTGVTVDIGVGDESSSNPGEVKTTTETIATTTLNVNVPAANRLFMLNSHVNYGAIHSGSQANDDNYHFWFRANKNVFKSLDFSKGISFFYAGNEGEYGTIDVMTLFRLDFTDGSYIYTRGDSNIQYRRLIYKDASGDNVEKEFRTGWGSAARRNGPVSSGSILSDYIKFYFSIGPVNAYRAGYQNSSGVSTNETWTATVTPYYGAQWSDLDFRGKTLLSCDIIKNDFASNASVEAADIACFGVGEKIPATFPRPFADSSGTAITGGSYAAHDAFKINYDRFFLFGSGDNDVITGTGYYHMNFDTSSTFSLKSHGDSGDVTLNVVGKMGSGPVHGPITTIIPPVTYITYNSFTIYCAWTNVAPFSNYDNPAAVVERVIEEATDEAIVTTSTITSPFTISDLITTVNNFTHVSISASASNATDITNIPASYAIPFDKIIIPKGGSIDLRYFREVDVTKGDTNYNYFNNLHTNFVNKLDTFQNVSHTIVNNNMYFATGVDEICKYDGSKLYRAGLPKPASLSANVDTRQLGSSDPMGLEANPSALEKYYYLIVYKHEDNNGNVITSQQSVTAFANLSHRGYVNLTIPMLQSGGWDLDNVKILVYRAPKTTTNEVVNAASFYLVTDGTKSSNIISNLLPSVSGVNINGNAVNNNPISNNKNVASIVFTDYLQDDLINTNDFITTSDYAEGRHDLPPKCKFITSHQGCLILAGTAESPSEVFYSLPEFNFATGEIGTEYFPNNANSVLMGGANGTNITGMKTLRESLLIFNEKSVSLLSGDLTTTGVQYLKRDSLTSQGEQGAVSSNSLQEWEGTLTFLSDEGILSTNTNLSYPTELSEPIKPLLLNKEFDRKRAISFFTADQDVLGFFIPGINQDHLANSSSEGIFSASNESRLFVYDVKIGGWLEWTDIDMAGGVARHKGETYFISRVGGRISLHLFKTAADKSSYSDFNQPIKTTLITSWDSLGNSAVLKKYVRLKVFCTDSNQAFEGNTFSLSLYLRSNFDNRDIGPIPLNPGTFGGWGIPEWGKSSWGSRNFKGIRTKLFGKSKAIALHFKNENINENILVSGYAMEIASPYNPEIKE